MTKKDYKAIGQALHLQSLRVTTRETSPASMVRDVAQAIATVFAADNPRFDRARFLRFVETGIDMNTDFGLAQKVAAKIGTEEALGLRRKTGTDTREVAG